MAYFSGAGEVYETLGRLMQHAARSGGLGMQLQQMDASIRLALSNPTATITLACSDGEEPIVAFGGAYGSQTLTLEMSADTAHEIFSGQLDLSAAASAGRLAQRGTSNGFWDVWPAAQFALPVRYAEILTAAGRADLTHVP